MNKSLKKVTVALFLATFITTGCAVKTATPKIPAKPVAKESPAPVSVPTNETLYDKRVRLEVERIRNERERAETCQDR